MKELTVYKCEAPGCVYTTLDKHQIHFHHIIPKSQGGKNNKFNLVTLCPNCHNRIYIPGTKRGIHSIKSKNYIILKNIIPSSGGYVLQYETERSEGYTLCDTWRNGNLDNLIKD